MPPASRSKIPGPLARKKKALSSCSKIPPSDLLPQFLLDRLRFVWQANLGRRADYAENKILRQHALIFASAAVARHAHCFANVSTTLSSRRDVVMVRTARDAARATRTSGWTWGTPARRDSTKRDPRRMTPGSSAGASDPRLRG